MNITTIFFYVVSAVFFTLSFIPGLTGESSRKMVEIAALFAIAGGVA